MTEFARDSSCLPCTHRAQGWYYSALYLVSEEEHDRARVIQLIHGIEVRNCADVYQVDHSKVLDLVCN